MANYTAELRQIVKITDIFDWAKVESTTEPVTISYEFNRTEQSKAIVSNDDLIQGFIDHYYFREIGFETVERFKKRLEVQWKESLGELDTLLVAYYNEPIKVKANNTNKFVNVNNDTPKNRLDFSMELDGSTGHADNINNGKSEGLNGLTEIESLEILHKHLRDIQTEFYDSLDNLFMQIY